LRVSGRCRSETRARRKSALIDSTTMPLKANGAQAFSARRISVALPPKDCQVGNRTARSREVRIRAASGASGIP
jgi:hypothetical protein